MTKSFVVFFTLFVGLITFNIFFYSLSKKFRTFAPNSNFKNGKKEETITYT